MIRSVLVALGLGALIPPLAAEVTPGEILIAEMNCVACHATSPEIAGRLTSREAPKLGKNGVRLRPRWIREFLSNPQQSKPGTLMPDMLHGVPEEQKAAAIEALTHFLVSIQPAGASPAGADIAQSIDSGRKLYHDVGCVQCHAPEALPIGMENDDAAKAGLVALQQTSVPIGTPAAKFLLSDLAGFLRDPLRSRPSGRMPSFRLTANEADAIARYLQRADRAPAEDAAFALDKDKAAAGAKHFISLRCAECHRDAAAGLALHEQPAPARAFAMLRPRQPVGCLATKPKPAVPKFDLTDRQRTVILVALQNQAILTAPLTTEQQVRRTMAVLNCHACHARDKRGGAEGLRRGYFTTRGGVNLGDEGRIPPSLTGIGAKLPPALLREALLTAPIVRPSMATRMPIYGEPNISHLPALFEKSDVKPADSTGGK